MFLITIFISFYFVHASAFVGLNQPCATSVECIGGTICQSRLCQCPPVFYTAASFGCVQTLLPARPAFPAPFFPPSTYPFVQQQIVAPAPLPIAQQSVWSYIRPEPSVVSAFVQKPTSLHSAWSEIGVYYALPGASCVQNKICVGNSFCSAGSCACPANHALVGKLCVLGTALAPAAVVLAPANADINGTVTTPTPSNETTNATTHSPVAIPVPALVPETLAEALKIPDPGFEANPSKLVELKTAAFNYLPVLPAPVLNHYVAKPLLPAVPLLNPAPVPLLNNFLYNYAGPVQTYFAKAPNAAQFQFFPQPNTRVFPRVPIAPAPVFAPNVNPYFNYFNQYSYFPFTQKKS